VTHGPRNEKNYERKINQKMRQKALLVALSRKMKDGEIIFVDSLEIAAPKTREAKSVFSAFVKAGFGMTKKKNAALIALPSAHQPTMKSFRNFGNVSIDDVRNLNPLSVLSTKYILIADPTHSLATLAKEKVVKEK